MSTPAPEGDASLDVQASLAEFANLNRRRLFGSPALDVREVERWLELRSRLEAHFAAAGRSDWTGIERREFFRLPTHIRLELGEGDAFQLATIRDVSQGGLFIATGRPLEKGSVVRIDLGGSLGEDPLEVSGHVAWVREERLGAEPPGMGVEFRHLDQRARALLSRLVQRAASEDGGAD